MSLLLPELGEGLSSDYSVNFKLVVCLIFHDPSFSEFTEIIAKNFDKYNNVEVWKQCFNQIDLTSLNSTDTEDKIGGMMERVNEFKEKYPEMPNVAAVCVYPALVPVTKATLETEGVNIAAVSACPLAVLAVAVAIPSPVDGRCPLPRWSISYLTIVRHRDMTCAHGAPGSRWRCHAPRSCSRHKSL